MRNKYSNKIKITFNFFKLGTYYPSNPLQPGPIYFLIPRKSVIFGVCCEALSQQVKFLVDESFSTGKIANAVVSMLHYYLEHHVLNSVIIQLNADNCSGQNKNNYK